MSSRFFVPALATALVASLLAACGSNGDGRGSDDQLVWLDYGGNSATAAEEAWLDPFAESEDVTWAMDAPTEPARVRAAFDAGQHTWDFIALDAAQGAAMCEEGLLVDLGDISREGIEESFVSSDCGIPHAVQTRGLVYNKDVYGDDPPTQITDFLDTERFPGRRNIVNFAQTGIELMMLASGVAPDELYPLDFDLAQTAVDKLGSDLVVHASVADELEMLTAGDFDMCMCYFARAALAADEGSNLGVVWHNNLRTWHDIYAVKGAKNPELQMEFMESIATPESNVAFADAAVTDTTATELKPDPQYSEFLASHHLDEFTPAYLDIQYWVENADEGQTRWTEMITQ